jgi:hypothetical protein
METKATGLASAAGTRLDFGPAPTRAAMAPNENAPGYEPKSLLFRLLLLTETCLKLRGTLRC